MIKVLCFASLKEQLGKDEFILDHESLTVNELFQVLEAKYNFQNDSIMVAINEEYAVSDDRIVSGDVVALIPPVSGG